MNITTTRFLLDKFQNLQKPVSASPQFSSSQFSSSLSPEAAAAERRRMQEAVMQDPVQRSIVEMAEQKAAAVNADLARLAPEYEMTFVRPLQPIDVGMVLRDGRYGYFTIKKKQKHQFGDSALNINGVEAMLKRHGLGEYKVKSEGPITSLTMDGFVVKA